MHRFDELIMRPMLIYKYEKNMRVKAQQFFHLFKEHGDEIQTDWHKDVDERRSSMKIARESAM